ncbi:glycosyltransferase family 2 protein [Flavobacterium artemisiae]|uniref:Glycosyltransferase family 2 protein n=1 Tax=Flavobacterium artemisiae TaxID=2126556 RepID=A0ABW4H897_9FLAO
MHKVSIIVPCYNQAQYLSEALESILNQTYENWECIIVNDGSPDNTHEIAQEWLKKDKRFKYLFKENGGLSSARNAGLDIAEGDYVQFLDADDLIAPEKFEISLSQLEKFEPKKQAVVVSHFNFFTNNIEDATDRYCYLNLEFLNYKSILYDWDYKFSVPIHCGFFSKELFEDFRFSTDLKAKEDWLMWLNIFKKDIKVYFINQPFAFYRSHSSSMTKNHQFMEENTIKVLKLFKDILSVEEYSDYLIHVIQKKNNENEKLRLELLEIKTSPELRVIKKIKKTPVISFIFKLCVSIFKSK